MIKTNNNRSYIDGINRGGKRSTIEVIGKVLEGVDVNSEFGNQNSELVQNVERIAEERIPEYKKLTETERESVRETVRRAVLNGVSEEDAALFGKISAKSGMKIIVTPGTDTSSDAQARHLPLEGEGSDAWYDGKNTVYVNADADRARTFSGLLGHEMWHKMFKSGKARQIMMQAYKRLDKAARTEVEEAYRADSESLGLGERDIKEINREEVAAAYAEEIFNSPDVWEFVLSEEQSLADRVLSFFRGANKKYSFEPGMTKAAKKWLNEYKKLFNEVSAYNKGMNVAENAVASEGVKKIERLGKLDGDKITLFGTNKEAENTLLRTLNAENAQKSTLTNMKQEKMHVSDSGERAALPDGLKNVDPTSVTEDEVKTLLNRASKKFYKDSSYIPVRINTPQILIETAASYGEKIENLPVVMQVEKVRQAMANEEQWYGENKTTRPHNLTDDDIISIIRAMNTPKYIVYQTDNERYVEIVKYKSKNDAEAIAVIEIGEDKNPEYLNGYKGGKYQVLITAFNPDENTIDSILNNSNNRVLYPKKKKGSSQRGSGNNVPSHLNDSPFAISIPQKSEIDNSFDENSSKKVDDGSRSALKKSDKEYRDEVKAKADEKIAKATAKAEAKYERATETAKARLEAEYQTDTTFSEASVKKSFDSVEAISKLKKAKREEIARELWLELQMSDEQSVRDTFVLKYSVKLYDEIRRADYDAYDNMTYGERDALKGELEAMMKKVIKSGKATFRSKMESDIKTRAKAEAEFRGDKLTEIYQKNNKKNKKASLLRDSVYLMAPHPPQLFTTAVPLPQQGRR